jgi:hypothetical protein
MTGKIVEKIIGTLLKEEITQGANAIDLLNLKMNN